MPPLPPEPPEPPDPPEPPEPDPPEPEPEPPEPEPLEPVPEPEPDPEPLVLPPEPEPEPELPEEALLPEPEPELDRAPRPLHPTRVTRLARVRIERDTALQEEDFMRGPRIHERGGELLDWNRESGIGFPVMQKDSHSIRDCDAVNAREIE